MSYELYSGWKLEMPRDDLYDNFLDTGGCTADIRLFFNRHRECRSDIDFRNS